MRRAAAATLLLLVSAGILRPESAGPNSAAAAATWPSTTALTLVSSADGAPLLPLRLPGYELRVLDRRKLLYYDVGGAWVEIPLPILFYFPTAGRSEALQLIRQAVRSLQQIAGGDDQPAGSADALARKLERALTLLTR